MPFEPIERLLEKYYDGESTLAEEAHLKTFFQETKLLPDHLKPHALQFNHYAQEQHVKIDKFLSDDWLFEKIENPRAGAAPAPEKKPNFFVAYGWQMAASISLLLVAFWAGYYFMSPSNNGLATHQSQLVVQQEKEEPQPIIEESTPAEKATQVTTSPEYSPAPKNPARDSSPRQKTRPLLTARIPVVASASARLQLVSQDLPTEGLTPAESKKVMDLLIKTMSKDDNVNVRLAACEALYRFKDQKEARQAFIQALATQTDPMMQITLIDIVISLKEKRALPHLEQLANQENVLPIVKHKAQEGLGTLI
ncbi:HEAT repeat domain-containing protein [Nibribacter koreensis]|uniref:HEAT repeat-containing protein n=1 Tax=Nibribacter koreensis TaxID=1084519 RepID=A0ABP8FTE9_9BACT